MKKAMTILEGLTLESGLRSLSAKWATLPYQTAHALHLDAANATLRRIFVWTAFANHAQKYHG